MFKSIVRQFNILKALAIHDLQGQMKSYNYGFAWMILEPIMFIVVFRMGRKVLGGLANPPGMTPLMFYVTGVFTLFLFQQGMGGASGAGQPNLLAFPRVTQLDLAVAKAASNGSIQLALFAIIGIPIAIYEGVLPPQNLNTALFAMLMAWVCGIGFGFFGFSSNPTIR